MQDDPNTMTLVITANNSKQALQTAEGVRQRFAPDVELDHQMVTRVADNKYVVTLSECPDDCEEENQKEVNKQLDDE